MLADASCGSGFEDGGGNVVLTEGCPDATLSSVSKFVDDLGATLSPLADHGGLVPTVALSPDSPAVDWVTGDCDATDARGVPRPQGAACDAGAFEVVPTTTTLTGPASVLNGHAARYRVGVDADGNPLGPPSGTVALYDGTTLLKTVPMMGPARDVSLRLRGPRGAHDHCHLQRQRGLSREQYHVRRDRRPQLIDDRPHFGGGSAAVVRTTPQGACAVNAGR